MTTIALPRTVHKGMAGVWIRIELVRFVKSRELNVQLVHILRRRVLIVGAEVTLDGAVNF